MKVLLANKFYYRRGGDCIYTMNVEQMLREHGHQVAVFSMQHPENAASPWQEYFPTEVRFKPGKGLLKAMLRPFGTKEVKQQFAKLIDAFKPDVVHLNNIHSQLSPVIGEIAHQRGVRVVWTLHDYKLLCPRYDCMLDDRQHCVACVTDKRSCLRHRCMKHSWLASYIGYKEAQTWNLERVSAFTDAFICPSLFMAEQIKKGGFDKHKIHHLCNFIDTAKCQREKYDKGDYYCYIGRLSKEKGVKTLIESANQLPYRLIIIGCGPMEQELKAIAGSHITFAGQKQWADIKKLVGQARFTVLPSECNENNPLTVIESKCLGTPVLGSRIGGIPELIDEERSGMTFTPYDHEDLKDKIRQMWDTTFDCSRLASDSILEYDEENYYRQLIDIYQK